MQIWQSLVRGGDIALGTGRLDSIYDIVPGPKINQAAMYSLCEDLYYNDIQEAHEALREPGTPKQKIRGIRNPSHAVVEYFVATVWPRGLDDSFPFQHPADKSPEDAMQFEENIKQVWVNSNWAVKKNLYIRRQAMLGDAFIKIATNQKKANEKPTRVFFRHLHPKYVTEFDVDERDYLTYIRIDVPRTRREANGDIKAYVEVEIWDKENGRFRIWHTERGAGVEINQLGTPVIDDPMEAYGVDYIPFVHAKFKDDGRRRGMSVLTPAIAKIFESDNMATRMNDMLFRFNRPEKAIVSNHLDPRGFPMPAPSLPKAEEFEEMMVGGERWYRFPSGWGVDNLVSAVNYQAHLEAINAQIESNRLTDFPSLTYYMLSDIGRDLSGKALRYMLTPAINQTIEARANSDWTMVRAHQMALSVMKANGLLVDGIDIGSYQDGDFEHWFGDRPVIGLSEEEQIGIRKIKAEAAPNRRAYGVTMKQLLIEDGFTEAEAEEMLAELPPEFVAGEMLEPVEDRPGDAAALFEAAMARD